MSKRILIVGLALLALALVALAADATGKWTIEQPGRGGGAPRVTTLDLKVDGAKLTGKVTVPGFGRGGDTPPPPTVIDLTNGKVNGDKISFDVVRDFNGMTMTSKYELTVKGDEMPGKITMPGMDGGDPRVIEITAKRAK